MSPVGGNGINNAVQDAAATANILSGPLNTRRISVRDLAAVQRRRDWPTRITQAVVNQLQDRVIGPALAGQITLGSVPPFAASLVNMPLLQRLMLTWMAYGLWPVSLSPSVRAEPGVPDPL